MHPGLDRLSARERDALRLLAQGFDAKSAAQRLGMSVTLDRPMTDDSYSFVQFSTDTYPGCAPKPALSRDRRTFTLRCTAVAGHQYQIGINSSPYMNFRDTAGIPATPYRLTFSTR